MYSHAISLMTIAGLCLSKKVEENEPQEQRMLAYFLSNTCTSEILFTDCQTSLFQSFGNLVTDQ